MTRRTPRDLTLISLLCATALVFFGLTPRAQAAASTIYRCLDNSGTQVFSDTDCSRQGLHARVPVSQKRPGAASANGSLRYAATSPTDRFGVGCHAHSPDGMRGALAGAIATGDVNAVSGLYQWQGANRSSAMATMRVLRDLTHKPVLAIELDQLYPGAGAAEAMTMLDLPERQAMPLLRVDQHAYADGGPVTSTHFRLREQAGCLWLAL